MELNLSVPRAIGNTVGVPHLRQPTEMGHRG